MSLRDDLRILERFLLGGHAHAEEWTAYTNLSAALTHEALVWLAALPALMEMGGKEHVRLIDDDVMWFEAALAAWTCNDFVGTIEGLESAVNHFVKHHPMICVMRNALAAAKAADEKMIAELKRKLASASEPILSNPMFAKQQEMTAHAQKLAGEALIREHELMVKLAQRECELAEADEALIRKHNYARPSIDDARALQNALARQEARDKEKS